MYGGRAAASTGLTGGVFDPNGKPPSCQKCFQPGHWTYQCQRPALYLARPSRTQILRNPRLRPKFFEADDIPDIPMVTDGDRNRDARLMEKDKSKESLKDKSKQEDEAEGDEEHRHRRKSTKGRRRRSSTRRKKEHRRHHDDESNEKKKKKRRRRHHRLSHSPDSDISSISSSSLSSSLSSTLSSSSRLSLSSTSSYSSSPSDNTSSSSDGDQTTDSEDASDNSSCSTQPRHKRWRSYRSRRRHTHHPTHRSHRRRSRSSSRRQSSKHSRRRSPSSTDSEIVDNAEDGDKLVQHGRSVRRPDGDAAVDIKHFKEDRADTQTQPIWDNKATDRSAADKLLSSSEDGLSPIPDDDDDSHDVKYRKKEGSEGQPRRRGCRDGNRGGRRSGHGDESGEESRHGCDGRGERRDRPVTERKSRCGSRSGVGSMTGHIDVGHSDKQLPSSSYINIKKKNERSNRHNHAADVDRRHQARSDNSRRHSRDPSARSNRPSYADNRRSSRLLRELSPPSVRRQPQSKLSSSRRGSLEDVGPRHEVGVPQVELDEDLYRGRDVADHQYVTSDKWAQSPEQARSKWDSADKTAADGSLQRSRKRLASSPAAHSPTSRRRRRHSTDHQTDDASLRRSSSPRRSELKDMERRSPASFRDSKAAVMTSPPPSRRREGRSLTSAGAGKKLVGTSPSSSSLISKSVVADFRSVPEAPDRHNTVHEADVSSPDVKMVRRSDRATVRRDQSRSVHGDGDSDGSPNNRSGYRRGGGDGLRRGRHQRKEVLKTLEGRETEDKEMGKGIEVGKHRREFEDKKYARSSMSRDSLHPRDRRREDRVQKTQSGVSSPQYAKQRIQPAAAISPMRPTKPHRARGSSRSASRGPSSDGSLQRDGRDSGSSRRGEKQKSAPDITVERQIEDRLPSDSHRSRHPQPSDHSLEAMEDRPSLPLSPLPSSRARRVFVENHQDLKINSVKNSRFLRDPSFSPPPSPVSPGSKKKSTAIRRVVHDSRVSSDAAAAILGPVPKSKERRVFDDESHRSRSDSVTSHKSGRASHKNSLQHHRHAIPSSPPIEPPSSTRHHRRSSSPIVSNGTRDIRQRQSNRQGSFVSVSDDRQGGSYRQINDRIVIDNYSSNVEMIRRGGKSRSRSRSNNIRSRSESRGNELKHLVRGVMLKRKVRDALDGGKRHQKSRKGRERMSSESHEGSVKSKEPRRR